MNISVVQFAPVLGDVKQNIERLGNDFEEAWSSRIVVLPELASSGYNFESREQAMQCSEELSDSRFVDFLEERAAEWGCYIVAGMNERADGNLFNTSVLVGPDGLTGVYRKLHLFGGEKTIFTPGDLGVEVYETPYGRIGMLICYDWMFPEVWRMMAFKGAQVVCHPCNLVLPYCQQVVASHALVNRFFVASANRVGSERDLSFTGQSIICSTLGQELVRGDAAKEQILRTEISVKEADEKWITPENHAFYDRRIDVYPDLSE